jgi:hypothetical protein
VRSHRLACADQLLSNRSQRDVLSHVPLTFTSPNVCRTLGRIGVFRVVIKLFSLLRCIQKELPSYMLPLGVPEVRYLHRCRSRACLSQRVILAA